MKYVVLLGLLMTTSLGCGTESPPAQEPAPEKEPTAVDEHELPYDIASRPMPESGDLDTLLPSQVGPYTRTPIDPATSRDEPIYANYRHGKTTVFVELGICDDASQAQMALATAKAGTDAEFPDIPQMFVKSRDVSCLKTVNRLGAFMAWTRGPYYFSAHAKGGEKGLDEFMVAFPY